MFLHIKHLFALLIIAAALLTSCADEPSWDVDVRTPVFSTSLGVNDIIADSNLLINPDTSLTFIFDYNLFSITTDSFVNMPDSLYYVHYVIPFGLQAPPGALVLPRTL